MTLHENSQQNNVIERDSGIRRTIGGMETYSAFISSLSVTTLNPCSPVEDIEQAAARADGLPHWLDRHRAADHIAKRVDVHVDLIFRLMRKGAK